jgi:hypothetical protein
MRTAVAIRSTRRNALKAKKSGKARSSRKRTTKDLPTRKAQNVKGGRKNLQDQSQADQLKLQGATNPY